LQETEFPEKTFPR